MATTIQPYLATRMSHFKLGMLDQDEAIAAISAANRRLVELRPNTFDLPYSTSGQEFIVQLGIYLECFAQGGPNEGHAVMIDCQIHLIFPTVLVDKSLSSSLVFI